MAEIESMKEELQALRNNLIDELKETKESKRKYADLIALFRKERDQWMERTVKKAEKKIEEMIDFSQVDNLFKRHEKLQQIKTELPEVVKASNVKSKKFSIETIEDFEKVYPPGSVVFIPSVGQEGIIQGKANAKGEIPVLSHSMR
ncbi:MAG: endonuclease MutS2, partial [Proteobacteria bacterium]